MDAIRSLCDRCVVMNVGAKIAEGPPAHVLADTERSSAPISETPMLEVRSLSARYGKHQALSDVALDVATERDRRDPRRQRRRQVDVAENRSPAWCRRCPVRASRSRAAT